MEPKPGNIYDIETGENLGEHKGMIMQMDDRIVALSQYSWPWTL